MPRKKRIALANFPHHIVQRGHNRKNVFRTDKDRLKYLETLQEFRLALGLKVYGYCLMTNHVHLIVDPGSQAENVSFLMKRLAGRHTRRINRLERKTGTSWAGSCSMHRRHSLHPCRSEAASNAARSNQIVICLPASATSISIL